MPVQVNRWARVEDFNPLSSQQTLAYLRDKKYKIPRDRKTRRETTGKDALVQLVKTYPEDRVLRLVLESRHLSKAIGYLDDSRLGRDGKFHPTYTFAPDTGRLASINPNFQNQPKGGVDEELATAIRETIVPSPGMVLVELDWKAIEAVLTGYFAGDEGYIRLSLLDSHSFLGWHIKSRSDSSFPNPPSPNDPNLERLLKGFKRDHPVERELAKKVNHATSYGMGPKHLSDVLKITKSKALEIMKIKDEASPKVAEWKAVIRRRAHFDGFLENPFGYRRYFSDVFRKDKSGQWHLGDEANKCLAFLPQSTGAGMLRAVVAKLPMVRGYREDWFPLVPIHDALLLEVQSEKSVVDRVKNAIREIMEVPWVELGGLSVPVDIKQGTNWAEMR
jgi:DNA polymerase I-like protein with 3'-5' exonuclease and polymerase domains